MHAIPMWYGHLTEFDCPRYKENSHEVYTLFETVSNLHFDTYDQFTAIWCDIRIKAE